MQHADEIVLPCQPRVLALLMRELLSDVPNMRKLNQLFGADPVLAAQLLGSANSSVFQLSGQVRGIPQALVLLGVRQLRALLKKAQQGLTVSAMPSMDMGQFARVSLSAAKRARSLASFAGVDDGMAYMAALLHGMGQLIWHQVHQERVLSLNHEVGVWDPRRPRLEVKHWGYSASSTTAALLRQWHFPEEVVQAVQAMESPMAADNFDALAGVLHLAVWCSRAQVSGWSERTMADAFPVDVALTLGVDVDVVLQQAAPDWRKSIY